MLEALIFLAAAVVCVPIAARLGLGSVLGYLIAGALIGPWGLRLISHAESAQNLAELGVVLMLFVIGLELDPRKLGGMRRTVFGGGTLQLAVSGAVLGVALAVFGFAWQAALIGGLALALSSTGFHLWWVRLLIGVGEVILGFWAAGDFGHKTVLLVVWVGAAALTHGIMDIVAAFSLRGSR